MYQRIILSASLPILLGSYDLAAAALSAAASPRAPTRATSDQRPPTRISQAQNPMLADDLRQRRRALRAPELELALGSADF